MSVGPPAGNGTMILMVRFGKLCACARKGMSPLAASPASTERRCIVMAGVPIPKFV
jgi:hypothetical protein